MSGETVISAPLSRIGAGYRLNDIYEIDSMLASGGMGEVYRGHAIETGDTVAIKTIRPEFAQNASALALFKKEASALRNLYHEAIVRYFVFSIDRGLPYLAMEFVEGKSLADMLKKGPLAFDDLRVLQARLASGLNAAHELGIVHRDVSPDNIILPGENCGRAKIIDFGIARSQSSGETVIGSGFAGKFNYVSPEQLGLHGGDVTGQSDIYSLGLVLAEAALGTPIDMGHTHIEVIEKRRKVPDLGGIDARIRPLISWMLQPDPKDRPASMAAVAAWAPSARRGGGGVGRTLGLAAGILVVLGGLGTGGYLYGPQLAALLPGSGGNIAGSGSTAGSVPREAPDGRSASADLREPSRPDPSRSDPAAAPAVQPPRETPPVVANLPPPVPAVPDPAPSPSPTPPLPANRPAGIDDVATYLRDYSGGECFFVSPITIASREARIEAFGATPQPFIAFDTDFQRSMGFEPEINLRQVTQPQCPVVDFLARRTAHRGTRVPKLVLKSDRLRSGQELSGSVDVRQDATVEVLLIADDGLVHNLQGFLKRQGETLSFSLRVEGSGAGDGKPQLVVAVATPRPLAALKMTGPVQAERLFRQLSEETNRSGTTVGVATAYFKLAGG